jgi:hypothetical protein
MIAERLPKLPVRPSTTRVQVLSPAYRAQLAAQRDRLRRRGWTALCCSPLGLVPYVISVVFWNRVPSDRDVVISGLLMFFGVLGALPVCLKIALDSMTASRRLTRYLNDGIVPEPARVRRPNKWVHTAAVAIALLHNPVAVFRGSERCFGDYATPWWMVALTLFIFIESVHLFVWWRVMRLRPQRARFEHRL